jgi:flagellar basal-body rod protein FlgB
MTAINFDNALGIHPQALSLRVRRAEVLANNLANADTPGFKARDIDFKSVLQGVQSGNAGVAMRTTHRAHIDLSGASPMSNQGLLYRTPLQPSIDGNTVDPHRESAEFAKNAMDFSASFRLLNSKFSGLSKAISGD